jgi:hypothetical protein
VHTSYPLRTWMAFLREPPRDPLAIVEALVTYAEHIVAPLPLLYTINQVQVTTHDHIMQRVPWEWEVSADLFIRDAADNGGTALAEECRQAQRSDSSPGRFII